MSIFHLTFKNDMHVLHVQYQEITDKSMHYFFFYRLFLEVLMVQ